MSQFIKDEMVAIYKLKEDKITVIPSACYVHDIKEEELAEEGFNAQFGQDYLFSVTTTWPHKNLITLLKAFVILRKRGIKKRLIVVGQNRLKNPEIEDFVEENQLDEDVYLSLGFVSDSTLRYLYAHAGILIFPSLYEGFGVPPLEAMRYGIPSVVANAASLPEVCGNACLYAAPKSPEEFADKIQNLLEDETLREEMIRRGKKREAEFVWPELAMKTLDVYYRVYGKINK